MKRSHSAKRSVSQLHSKRGNIATNRPLARQEEVAHTATEEESGRESSSQSASVDVKTLDEKLREVRRVSEQNANEQIERTVSDAVRRAVGDEVGIKGALRAVGLQGVSGK